MAFLIEGTYSTFLYISYSPLTGTLNLLENIKFLQEAIFIPLLHSHFPLKKAQKILPKSVYLTNS